MADESYIQLTLEIAKKGEGNVSPNPLVGCVITKDNRIIGAGYHQKFGEEHAEINAINSATESLEGSTLFVNLEPCSHHGKTPPCVDRIIEEKIKRVVIGTLDVNPLVSGSGVKKLKKAGVDVKVGVLEKECLELNKFFFKNITKKIPYITLKAAQTLDGMIADKDHFSNWISCNSSRQLVHSLRSKYDAVLIGSHTAKIDDPKLTVRMVEGRNPHRIVLDSSLKLNPELKLFKIKDDKKTFLVTSVDNKVKERKIEKFKETGTEIIFVKKNKNGRLDLLSLMKKLSKQGISSVLVEGGGKTFSSFLKQDLFDDILLFISPKILGEGIKTFSDLSYKKLKQALKLKVVKSDSIGEDILIKLTR